MADHSPADVDAVVRRFLDLRRNDRRASIDAVLDGDEKEQAELRAAVLRTIAGDRLASSSSDSIPDADAVPTIDGYDIIDELGRGGMGVVFEAYQQSTGRRVAIKLLLDAALQSESARRRFEREVDLIARLQHPGIVSVIDSGVRQGRYFYVMDYLDGEPLDAHVRAGFPPIRDAMALLIEICGAVEYAHERGVLHRDLKPSNIMLDREGHPHLLDFGLARTVAPPHDGPARHSVSQDGQLVGTIAYMAPEQARGDLDAIGIRTDVYGLGVIAYELVTGRLPVEMAGPLGTVLQRIEDVPPKLPSTHRPGTPRDIDAIVLRCLEKAPDQRYGSVGEIAADIGRWQRREPVVARRPGVMLRASRWMSRNRIAVSICAAAVLILTAVLVNEYQKHVKERNVLSYNSALMDLNDPNRDPETFAAAAVEAVNRYLTPYPSEKATAQLQLGDLLIKREAYDLAHAQFAEALRIREARLGPDSLPAAQARHDLGRALFFIGMRQGDREAVLGAHDAYSKSLATRRRKGAPAGDIATTIDHLASTCAALGMSDDARRLFSESLELRQSVFGPQSIEVMQSRNNLAAFLIDSGDHTAAEPLLREILTFIESMPDSERPQQWLARTLHSLGMVLVARGETVESDRLLTNAIAMKRRQTGDETLTVARSMFQLARLRVIQERFDEARILAEDVAEIRRQRGKSAQTAEQLIAEINAEQRASGGTSD